MSGGAYFIIGGIKGGPKVEKILRAIFALKSEARHILYVGAASFNCLETEKEFMNFMSDNFPEAKAKSLNIESRPEHEKNHPSPHEIKEAFFQSDIIFFNGGDVPRLKAVFDRHDLASLCHESAEYNNAVVGGMCAGGAILADRIVCHHGNETTSVEEGSGILKGYTVSCMMDHPNQETKRLEALRQISSSSDTICLGINRNETVIFKPDGSLYCLAPRGQTAEAFIIRPCKTSEPLTDRRFI
ncbi:MAG: Type 1 glutamine amidotransferase-like domain-containing protein [Alphaproteobacteria bacterium]|nr:Type 1 glutamine amidotransferase-like domain-containing protein [Alphaproteobacteria bacterium]